MATRPLGKWRPEGLGARFFCVVPGCVAPTTRLTCRECFCDRHWLMVPSDVKTILERKYRPTKVRSCDWTQPFERAIDQAVNEVLQVQLSGHRIPKATEFMFDEP